MPSDAFEKALAESELQETTGVAEPVGVGPGRAEVLLHESPEGALTWHRPDDPVLADPAAVPGRVRRFVFDIVDRVVQAFETRARPHRLRMFPDVASLPMRPPTMLAKAAASMDVMSGGRFELGLGAGAFWDAVAGMGGVRRGRGETGDALEEAIQLIRAALDVGPERGVARGPGPHYPIPGYPPGPPTAAP